MIAYIHLSFNCDAPLHSRQQHSNVVEVAFLRHLNAAPLGLLEVGRLVVAHLGTVRSYSAHLLSNSLQGLRLSLQLHSPFALPREEGIGPSDLVVQQL